LNGVDQSLTGLHDYGQSFDRTVQYFLIGPELTFHRTKNLELVFAVALPVPPRVNRESQQDAAYDDQALHGPSESERP